MTIAALRRVYAALRGFDDETGSVPMMDGPLRPNALLDAAGVVLTLADVDNLTPYESDLLCSSGARLLRLARGAGEFEATELCAFPQPISFVAAGPSKGLAVGLDGRGVLIVDGPHANKEITEVGGRPLSSPTSALFIDADRLIVANGAAGRPAAEWKRDLMERGASGSLWLVDFSGQRPTATAIAERLAFPCGLGRSDDGRILLSEAWLHRILALDIAAQREPTPLLSDLPAYPGRLTPAHGGGFWLAMFAPRNQLVEFVLREPKYRRRMIDSIHPDFWIAPSLYSGRSFLEPIQGGARKKLNTLKPWSPSWSCGLVVRCNGDMRPLFSLHSRADGAVHGVTSCCEFGATLYVAAKGAGRIVALPVPGAQRP